MVSHCAALIGVAAKASTIRHGSVRTHLKLIVAGLCSRAGWDGMADAFFTVVTRAGGANMLLEGPEGGR